MPERVAVTRIVVGKDKERKTIEPGTRFNTEEYDISAEQLEKWDKSRRTREPRDQPQNADSLVERSRRGEVVEGRSGPARDVTHPSESELAGREARVLEQPRDARPANPQAGHPQAGQPAQPVEHQREERRTRRGETDL